MKNAYVKWWLCFSTILIILCTVLLGGFANFVYVSDKTYLSWIIISIFIFASLFLGKICRDENTNSNLSLIRYSGDLCTSLGLLGTILGLIIVMVSGFSNLDVTNHDSLKTSLIAISSGIGTALVTTLIGLVCSLLLQIQLLLSIGPMHINKDFN